MHSLPANGSSPGFPVRLVPVGFGSLKGLYGPSFRCWSRWWRWAKKARRLPGGLGHGSAESDPTTGTPMAKAETLSEIDLRLSRPHLSEPDVSHENWREIRSHFREKTARNRSSVVCVATPDWYSHGIRLLPWYPSNA